MKPALQRRLRHIDRTVLDDYTELLEPALREGAAAGKMRLLFALTDFEGLAAGAWVEDVKTGLRAWTRDRDAWERMAFATDVKLEQGKAWVAGEA